jgi:L-threonylcarbamoyladenylate synthase
MRIRPLNTSSLPKHSGGNGLRERCKTTVFKVDPKNPDIAAIEQAAKAIKKGHLVAFPTETVYGIAANLLSRKAVDMLYEVKKRFRDKPFTVHIADMKTVREMGCVIPKTAASAIKKFWPGPLTVILRSKYGRKIGFRMPANKVAIDLIRASKVPVIAPSANISGNTPPTDAGDVLKELSGKIDILIDSGPAEVGVESTVADFTVKPPVILREGAIKRTALMKALKG